MVYKIVYVEEVELDSEHQNWNVRGRQGLKKDKVLILFTVCNISKQFCATSYIVSVDGTL